MHVAGLRCKQAETLLLQLPFGVTVWCLSLFTLTERFRLAGQGFNPGWEQVSRGCSLGAVYSTLTYRDTLGTPIALVAPGGWD